MVYDSWNALKQWRKTYAFKHSCKIEIKNVHISFTSSYISITCQGAVRRASLTLS